MKFTRVAVCDQSNDANVILSASEIATLNHLLVVVFFVIDEGLRSTVGARGIVSETMTKREYLPGRLT